jgi:hypothetical protein
MYPPSALNARVPDVPRSGRETDVATIVDIENIAYAGAEYAKQAVSLSKNDIARGECGKEASW